MMGDSPLERRAFYQLEDGRIVQPLERGDSALVVEDPTTGERWTVRAEPFEERVRDGYIQRVRPNWELADEADAAEA